MTTILLTALVAFVAASLARDSYASIRDRDGTTRRTLRALRLWQVPAAWALIAAVVLTGSLLSQVPGLGTGWWGLLGGSGNVLLGQTEAGSGVPPWLTLLVPLLALAALPRLARIEEETFRRGSQHRSPGRRLVVALAFGLVHAIVGIPLGWALALTVAGLGFDLAYRRAYAANVQPIPEALAARVAAIVEAHPGAYVRIRDGIAEDRAVDTASALHTVYNVTAVGLLLAAIIAGGAA